MFPKHSHRAHEKDMLPNCAYWTTPNIIHLYNIIYLYYIKILKRIVCNVAWFQLMNPWHTSVYFLKKCLQNVWSIDILTPRQPKKLQIHFRRQQNLDRWLQEKEYGYAWLHNTFFQRFNLMNALLKTWGFTFHLSH